MLAKYWKKFLLAICIIACIYNIMSKIVNRASLEANLQRANDGNTVFDFSSKKSTDSNTADIIEGVVSKNESSKNSVEDEKITEETENEIIEEDNDEINVVENSENDDGVGSENTEETEDGESSEFKFSDFSFGW